MLFILELINYISLSSSLRVFSISLVDFSCLSLYVSRVRTMVLSDVFYSSRITPLHPPPPPLPINALRTHIHADTVSNPLSRLPILRHFRASNHSRLSRPGNFMLELTGSMEGTSQRDPHPGRRPVIFHHLHFRATPAALQPLAPISPRNCWRREKFRERGRVRADTAHRRHNNPIRLLSI